MTTWGQEWTNKSDEDHVLLATLRQWPGVPMGGFGELHDHRLGRHRDAFRDASNFAQLISLATDGRVVVTWDGDLQFYLPEDAKIACVVRVDFAPKASLLKRISSAIAQRRTV